jgi:NAD(P)H-flavin reductase
MKVLQSHPFTLASYEKQSILKDSVDEITECEVEDRKAMQLLVRKYKGITSQLAKLSSAKPSIMLVEGPYGRSLPLHRYENLTFLAGGIGISALLAHTRAATDQVHSQLHFVWVARTEAEVEALRPSLLSIASIALKITIFVTSSKTEEVSIKLAGFQDISVKLGRPVLLDVIREDSDRFGSMACVACGPYDVS